MEEKLVTIGKLASMTGISQKSLRLYDRLGLLKPKEVDSETGYRYYSLVQPWAVGHIKYLQSLKLTLEEIEYLVNVEDMGEVADALRQKVDVLSRERDELDHAVEGLSCMAEAVEAYRPDLYEGEFILEREHERQYVFIELPEGPTPTAQQYEDFAFANDYCLSSYTVYAERAREFGIPTAALTGLGTYFDEEHLSSGELVPSGLIAFDLRLAPLGEMRRAPAGLYLSVCFDDMKPDSEGRHRDVTLLRDMLDEVRSRGFRTLGGCLDEAVFRGIRGENYTRLQVRVEKVHAA